MHTSVISYQYHKEHIPGHYSVDEYIRVSDPTRNKGLRLAALSLSCSPPSP